MFDAGAIRSLHESHAHGAWSRVVGRGGGLDDIRGGSRIWLRFGHVRSDGRRQLTSIERLALRSNGQRCRLRGAGHAPGGATPTQHDHGERPSHRQAACCHIRAREGPSLFGSLGLGFHGIVVERADSPDLAAVRAEDCKWLRGSGGHTPTACPGGSSHDPPFPLCGQLCWSRRQRATYDSMLGSSDRSRPLRPPLTARPILLVMRTLSDFRMPKGEACFGSTRPAR